MWQQALGLLHTLIRMDSAPSQYRHSGAAALPLLSTGSTSTLFTPVSPAQQLDTFPKLCTYRRHCHDLCIPDPVTGRTVPSCMLDFSFAVLVTGIYLL